MHIDLPLVFLMATFIGTIFYLTSLLLMDIYIITVFNKEEVLEMILQQMSINKYLSHLFCIAAGKIPKVKR